MSETSSKSTPTFSRSKVVDDFYKVYGQVDCVHQNADYVLTLMDGEDFSMISTDITGGLERTKQAVLA